MKKTLWARSLDEKECSSGNGLPRIGIVCLGLVFALAMLAQGQDLPEAGGVITTFDVTGAGTGAFQGTLPVSINGKGTIAGSYRDNNSVRHAFFRTKAGVITTFDAPGAGTNSGQGTYHSLINNAGTIAGIYTDSSGVAHGFVRSTTGIFVSFDAPGAGTGQGQGTFPEGINSMGDISGQYLDTNGVYHSFVRSHRAGNKITDFDAANAGTQAGQGTQALGINASGQITGSVRDENNIEHCFVRAKNGTITEFDDPQYAGSYGNGINKSGTVAGEVWLHGQGGSGAVLSGGTFTTFVVPGSGTGDNQGTIGWSINTLGVVTGWYIDSNSVVHGYVRATNGTLTPFDAPGAGTGSGQGTQSSGINDGGVITGYDLDSSNVYHGFYRTK